MTTASDPQVENALALSRIKLKSLYPSLQR